MKLMEHLRIIWAITAKDLVDALKNRTTLINLVMVVLMMLFYRYNTDLLHKGETLHVRAVETADSIWATSLKESSALDVDLYPAQEKMEMALSGSDVPELGLVAANPSGEAADGTLMLEGYVMDWVQDDEAEALRVTIEAEAARTLERPVQIAPGGRRIASYPDSSGRTFTASIALIFALLMIGVGVVPHLMLEEKRTRTLDALLVSPARSGHLIAAKALTGLIYSALIAGATLALYYNLVAHWALTLLALFLGALFSVALGLFFGTVAETQQQFTLFGFGVLAVLFIAAFLADVALSALMPSIVGQIVPWVPSTALAHAFRVSFSSATGPAAAGRDLALLAASIVVLLGLISWRVRRETR